MRSLRFNKTDLMLIDALQTSPRAPWSEIGVALGMDPMTLRHRWKRLAAEGLAWVTCYPNLSTSSRGSFAFVELDCRSSTRGSVVAELSKDSEAFSIECTTGRRDIFVSVMMGTLSDIDAYVEERIALIPGVNDTRTHHVRRMFAEGGDWRIDAMTQSQRQRLREPPHRGDQSVRATTPLEEKLMTALGENGRRSASSIAAEFNVSVSAISRCITRVLFAGRGTLRCDFAHNHSPWSVIAVVWLTAPHDQVSSIAAAMSQFPQVRVCCLLASEANLMIQVWMRSLNELDTIEQALAQDFPRIRVFDRWIVSRIMKRMGHTLGYNGVKTGYVPLHSQARL